MFKRYLFNIKTYVPGKPIEEVKREFKLKKVIKLASNENAWGPSKRVKEAILKELSKINRYPLADCYYLRRALALKFKVKEDQIIIGNGSDELIVLVLRALVEKGDEVIVAWPTFLIYEIQARISGAKVIRVKLKNFKYDLEGMKKKITKKTKIIFIANPDNPTGSFVNNRELENFLKSVPENILVFIDEAYFEYARLIPSYPDSLQFLKDNYNNIFISRTFSKAYGLAGLRIGYGISNNKNIEILNKVREPFNVNSLAQIAALHALKDQEHLQKVVRATQREKEKMYEELRRMGLEYKETATNFILIKVHDSQKVCRELLKKGIIVRDLDRWGLKGFIRVTVGRPIENVQFLKEIRRLV